jgi:actin-binding protein anillin
MTVVSDTTVHYFVVMLRLPSRALFTQMVSTHDAMVKGTLDFPNLMKINDISQDFKVDLEIYGMVSFY